MEKEKMLEDIEKNSIAQRLGLSKEEEDFFFKTYQKLYQRFYTI